jgi:RimJ/RimL family protein N-acetyltransferase
VRRYLCDDAVLPRSAVADLLKESEARGVDGLGLWGIEAGPAWIGCAGLQPVSPTVVAACPDLAGEVEPVIALHPAAWGQGYAAEALAALIDRACGRLRLRRLVALVDGPNTASHALLHRSGFAHVGTVKGRRHPLHVYERRWGKPG